MSDAPTNALELPVTCEARSSPSPGSAITCEQRELAAWVGGMMACYAYSQRDSQMMAGAARESGLYQLKTADRETLMAAVGAERVAEFERACGLDSPNDV